MNSFRWVLDELELKELHLHGRHFTWTSETSNPTQTKIDHVFYTRESEMDHPDWYLQAIGTSGSDHCPMILTCTPFNHRYRGFRFEAFWLRQPGFLEVVKESWERPAVSHNKARTLHIKLSRLAKALKAWGHSWVDELKQQAALAEQSELQLDQLQEQRQLSQDEISLRKLAKDRILGMAVLRRVKIRQRSRLTTMRVGDANSRLFHLHATSRRRKNHIPALVHMGTTYTAQKQKAAVLHSHFSAVLGTTTQRVQTLNWEVLQVQPHDLSSLNIDITVEEIRKVVMSAPPEKALGAEGYIGGFFKVAWDIRIL